MPEPTALYETLKELGFGDTRINPETMNDLYQEQDKEVLFGLAIEIYKQIPISRESGNSVFDFAISENFYGSASSCNELPCRLEQVQRLGEFCGLYSTKALLPAPFEDFILNEEPPMTEFLQHEIATQVSMFYQIKPLVENGVLSFRSNIAAFCSNCLEKHRKNKEEWYQTHMKPVEEKIRERFEREVRYTLVPEGPAIRMDGPEDLVEHGCQFMHFYEIPPDVEATVTSTETLVDIKLKTVRDIIDKCTSSVVWDLMDHAEFSASHNYSFLTARPINIDILQDESRQQGIENDTILSEAPSPINLDLSKIVSLRQRREEDFVVFLDQIKDIVQERRVHSEAQLTRELRERADHESRKIEKIVKNHCDDVNASYGTKAAVGSFTVGAGLLSGLVPPEVSEYVAAPSGAGALYGVSSYLVKHLRDPSEARAHPYYFYWKANKQKI